MRLSYEHCIYKFIQENFVRAWSFAFAFLFEVIVSGFPIGTRTHRIRIDVSLHPRPAFKTERERLLRCCAVTCCVRCYRCRRGPRTMAIVSCLPKYSLSLSLSISLFLSLSFYLSLSISLFLSLSFYLSPGLCPRPRPYPCHCPWLLVCSSSLGAPACIVFSKASSILPSGR